MKVLVIGGAGYIGSHVCLEHMEAGHDVVVYDNLSSGRRENLFEGERFVEGDIMDTAGLGKAMSEGFLMMAAILPSVMLRSMTSMRAP